jgi:hypothetical protein
VNRVRIASAAAATGAALGVGAALGSSEPHRAAIALAAQIGGGPVDPAARTAAGPILPTLAEIARSDVVAQNVARSTGVSNGSVHDHLHVRVVPQTALLELSYDGPTSVEAERVAQQAAVVFTSIVTARFGSGPRAVRVTVIEPVHPASGPGRPILRDALLGALAGGALGAFARPRRRRPREARPPGEVVPQALAGRASVPRGPVPAFVPAEPAPRSEREAVPVPERPPEPEPELEPELDPAAKRWSIDDLEQRAIAAAGPRLDERLAYLAALRPQARQGYLGPEYDGIVYDVFDELVD